MPLDFKAWPSIARLNREMIVTEKIDGSNAAVIIEHLGVYSKEDILAFLDHYDSDDYGVLLSRPAMIHGPELEVWPGHFEVFEVGAQSRKRLISPSDDNFGFARWVRENADALLDALGEGRHYGEWWGSGIQRGYGLPKGEKRFSLFNVSRYESIDFKSYGLENVATVPVLWRGPFDMDVIRGLVEELGRDGSLAVLELGKPRFGKAEGVVIYHVAANQLFKVTCEHDESPKSLVNA